ncbi:MFS transporter [Corynebacterium choanae]|uniref:MFS transporter n=1 Tax=Corynebacterium choanae TaxID=1862358 RepID=UPI001FE72F08|nr:MFS transporter [Corynebacterium choanae]
MSTRTARLDELPVTKAHAKIVVTSGLGWAMDAMDIGLMSFIMAALIAHWGLSPTETSWLAAIGFVGMAIGASLGGLLADKYGRRTIFAATLLVYGIATGASAAAGGLAVLIVLRFIVGLGLGAELPVASTYVSEFAPLRFRGRMVVLLEAFWALGWIAAALIGRFVVGTFDSGWRWAFVIGCIPAVYAVVVRRTLPESVRFLETTGNHAAAEGVVRQLEKSPPLSRISSQPKTTIAVDTDSTVAGAASIFAPALRRRTIALWTVWLCLNFAYYGAFLWLPALLHADGFTLVKSFSFTLIMTFAQLPGYALAAFAIERWGRRPTLAAMLIGSAIAAGLFALSSADWQIIAAGSLLSLCNLGAWGALYAIGPELYPTHLRSTGTGQAAAVGRIASIIAPLAVPLIPRGGLFVVFAAAFVIASVAALLLPEQRGKTIA